jgi:hypothetical protein
MTWSGVMNKRLGVAALFSLCILLVGVKEIHSSALNKQSVVKNIKHTEDPNAFTVIVGVPYAGGSQNGTVFFDDLINNLSPSQTNIPIQRVLLSVENPTQNGIYSLSNTLSGSGAAVNFLAALAKNNPNGNLAVFVVPDIETGNSYWANWTPPSFALHIPSCENMLSATDNAQKSMLATICYASAVNLLVKNIGVNSFAINGVAYDGQSLIMQDTDSNRLWLHNQVTADNLRLGWISSGLKSSVDLNLIEVYDLNKGAQGSLRIDTVTPESVYKVVSGVKASCADGSSPCSYTGDFPGTQWMFANGVGTVGANIYQCAISSSNMLLANGCDNSYTSNVDTSLPADQQMMQSLDYIFTNQPKKALSINIYGVPPAPTIANNKIVYLLSTQYIGPVGSYAGSKQQCNEKSGSCSCIASKYNASAPCGDENGFGSWGSNLEAFKLFANEFLASQSPCTAPGGCSMGIYMYDYIPQQWLP